MERVGGVLVTAALCTICNLWQSREVHQDVLRAAFEEGPRQGKIIRKQMGAPSRNPEGKDVIAALRQRMTALPVLRDAPKPTLKELTLRDATCAA